MLFSLENCLSEKESWCPASSVLGPGPSPERSAGEIEIKAVLA